MKAEDGIAAVLCIPIAIILLLTVCMVREMVGI